MSLSLQPPWVSLTLPPACLFCRTQLRGPAVAAAAEVPAAGALLFCWPAREPGPTFVWLARNHYETPTCFSRGLAKLLNLVLHVGETGNMVATSVDSRGCPAMLYLCITAALGS